MKGVGRWHGLGAGICALFLVGNMGCTGSEELVSETGTSSVDIVMSPPGAGRYETGLLTLVQVTIRPTDPVADQTLGATPIGMIPVPVQLALVDPSTVQTQIRPLSEGEYRLDTLTFRYPQVRDFDPVDPPTSCLEGVLLATRTAGLLPPPELTRTFTDSFVFTVGPFTPPVVFSVPRLGATTVRMLIDGPGLAELFESSFTCRSSGSCTQSPQTFPAPCMSGFTPFTPEQIAPLITFE